MIPVTRSLRTRNIVQTTEHLHEENGDVEVRRSCRIRSRYGTVNQSVLFDKLITNTAEAVLQKMDDMKKMRRQRMRELEDLRVYDEATEDNLNVYTRGKQKVFKELMKKQLIIKKAVWNHLKRVKIKKMMVKMMKMKTMMMKMKTMEKKIIRNDTILDREKLLFTTRLHWKNLVTRGSPIYFIVAQLLLQDQDIDYLLRDQEALIVNE